MRRICDVQFVDSFWSDWDNAPQLVRNKLSSQMNIAAAVGVFPNSLNIHNSKAPPDAPNYWIGHVTRGFGSWRVLVTQEDDGLVLCHRLLNHKQMENFFKNLWNQA